jgi:hypothetical protein
MSALVFDIQGGEHFQEVRAALIRIPEVIQKIRHVQEILDQKGIALDLSNFIASDDGSFLHHYRRKEFAGIILQLGLFDRYLRFFNAPDAVVGVANSISALRVVSGQITLEQLVDEAFRKPKPVTEIQELPGLPILTGIQIPKYQAVKINSEDGSVVTGGAPVADLTAVLESIEDQEIFEIGLGHPGRRGTIELDKQLSWVWDQVTEAKTISQAN